MIQISQAYFTHFLGSAGVGCENVDWRLHLLFAILTKASKETRAGDEIIDQLKVPPCDSYLLISPLGHRSRIAEKN